MSSPVPDDDRITCADDCREWRHGDGRCRAAPHPYTPVADVRKRCELLLPHKSAADQRTGRQRWPGLDQVPGGPTFVRYA